MKIALLVKTNTIEKYVKMLPNDKIGLVDTYEESTLIDGEQKAFIIRRNIINQLGPKTKVEFIL